MNKQLQEIVNKTIEDFDKRVLGLDQLDYREVLEEIISLLSSNLECVKEEMGDTD